jgi:hypothetical protein
MATAVYANPSLNGRDVEVRMIELEMYNIQTLENDWKDEKEITFFQPWKRQASVAHERMNDLMTAYPNWQEYCKQFQDQKPMLPEVSEALLETTREQLVRIGKILNAKHQELVLWLCDQEPERKQWLWDHDTSGFMRMIRKKQSTDNSEKSGRSGSRPAALGRSAIPESDTESQHRSQSPSGQGSTIMQTSGDKGKSVKGKPVAGS